MSNPEWMFAVGPGANVSPSGADRELTRATGRVITWRTAGHAFAQFTIDGRSDDIADLELWRDDLWVWRDGILLFRGRLVGAQPTIDPTSHTVQFQAVDYRGLLGAAAKVTPPIPTWTSTDQAQIVWELVEHWQALPGGNYGITEGLGASSGTTRDETDLTAGTPIAEAIDRLLDRDGGGEWEISPELELNRWFPTRGVDNGVVLDYGGTVSHVTGATPTFGNAAIATGSQETTPATSDTADVGTDERGRWAVAQAFSSVTRQSYLTGRATWLRDQASTIEHEWAVTLTPGYWEGKDHMWIGDIAQLRIADGWLSTIGDHRIVELQATPGDDGTETVRLGLVGVAS